MLDIKRKIKGGRDEESLWTRRDVMPLGEGGTPRGFMKWIPKGCEVPNEKKKSIGLTFVKGPNLVA